MENKETVVKSHSRFTNFIIFLSFLLSFLLTLAAIYFWFDSRSTERHVQRLRTQVAQHQRILDTTQTTLQDLTQPQIKKTRALNQAQYLVQLANLNLDFQGSVPLAINLLKSADQELAVVDDPTLIRIRQLLTNDIMQLEAVSKLDLPGLILKINAISEQIPQLPIVPTELSKPTTTTDTTTTTSELPAWRRGLNAIGQALTNVVVVRHLDQPITPLIPPQQQAYLILNIQLELAEAKWAALHQQPEIYQHSLQQAINWIKQYFLQKEPITQNILQQLTDLQKINVKPVLPSISDSLNAIQAVLNALSTKISVTRTTSLIS